MINAWNHKCLIQWGTWKRFNIFGAKNSSYHCMTKRKLFVQKFSFKTATQQIIMNEESFP